MQGKIHSRRRFRSLLVTALLTLYLVPIFLLGPGGSQLHQGVSNLRTLFLGALFCGLGIWVFLLLIKRWEQILTSDAQKIAQQRAAQKQNPFENSPQIASQAATADGSTPLIGNQENLTNVLRIQLQQELQEKTQNEIATLKENYELDLEAHQQKLQKFQKELTFSHEQLEQKALEWSHKEIEYRSYKSELEQQLSQKENQLRDFQQAYLEQKNTLQKKQERISFLENKIRDLTYEIRTLLQLEEIAPPQPATLPYQAAYIPSQTAPQQVNSKEPFSPKAKSHQTADSISPAEQETWPQESPAGTDLEVRTQYDAYVLLQKYLHVAQNLTGALHLGGNSSRFRNLSLDSYAIDLRRLFDSFRGETASVITIYSPSERRLLFANDIVRSYFGWSPERFVKDFGQIIQGGKPEWEAATATLTSHREAHLRLIIRTKGNTDVLAHCCLGLIPSGAFQGLAIGILYRS